MESAGQQIFQVAASIWEVSKSTASQYYNSLVEDENSTMEVFLLGKYYDLTNEQELFMEDLRSRIWISYRTWFPYIGDTSYCTDSGWGCMLRCGQMILAEALTRRFLGREWRKRGTKDPQFLKLISLFYDAPEFAYSIHNIATQGLELDKNIGQWFGPSTVAQAIKHLVLKDYSKEMGMAIHVSMDGMICKNQVKNSWVNVEKESETIKMAALKKKKTTIQKPREEIEMKEFPLESECNIETTQTWIDALKTEMDGISFPIKDTGLLLLIPLRLGLSSLNDVYVNQLQNIFKLKSSLGIIGGKPNSAYFFVGVKGEDAIYLDPHTTQLAAGADGDGDLNTSSYFSESVNKINIREFDPSMTLGFYFSNEDELQSFYAQVSEIFKSDAKYSLFTISDQEPDYNIFQNSDKMDDEDDFELL